MCSFYESSSVSTYRRCIGRFLVAAALASIVMALAADSSYAQQDDLSALVQEAAEDFQPVTDDDLEDARADLVDDMKALERFVRPSTRNGERWLRYLRWDDLKDALSAEGHPDPSALAATYRQLNRDENGLELQPFRRVSDALLRYNQLLQLASQEDQPQYYRRQLERLQTQLEEHRRDTSPDAAYEIGSRLGFIAGIDQAPELVRAVRREFAQPNAFLEVKTSLVAAAVEPIDRSEQITDCILGTFIRGDAHSVGQVGVASIPSEDGAVLELVSDGRTRSHNRGTNGPAVIYSNSVTDFSAIKRVELSDEAFETRDSRARASTDTHLQSVSKQGGGLGSRLVSNIGWKRARQSERQAEAIASDHAEDRIERRIDDEVNDEIREARNRYEEEFRRPLQRRGELPEHIRFHSDEDSLGMEVAQVNRNQVGAPGTPPDAPSGHDMTMRLHETAVNNYTASLLGGATASETEPGRDVQFDVKVPEWIEEAWQKRKTQSTEGDDKPFKPYSLTFREGRPVTANFVDGQLKLTIHIARLRSGDNTFSNWDVTGTYTSELADGGVRLRREGDLQMLPANFRGQLSSRQVAERSNLEKELNERSEQGRGFPKEIEFDSLEPDGALADAGPLEFNEFQSDAGWLTVAWDRRHKASQ